ncbi:MAG TPA: tetratricopeptide repeat protein [Pyrinomonadaceae bacterium]|nr:tetratricopeptide repeat protein [Pyrinomonadaceae bacterium]
MVGKTISRYRIIEPLGEGGMGAVYLAEDITLGRRVAIKLLSSTAPEYRARFLREARAVSQLIHPNIATVFDYGETPEGKPYIVMELIKGKPLSEKLLEGPLRLPEAVRIVSLIAAALGEAHQQGVVHRDVKPSNVVLTDRGHVKVVDFGLVKEIHGDVSPTRTRSDVIVGTPLYLSPEQATGKSVDGRSDLFALGAVLYECITGQSAFTGGSVIEIGAQVIHVTPPAPSSLNDQIPPELDRITAKALEKNIDARYQTAEELIEDLQTLLPTLDANGFRTQERTTKSVVAPRTHSASALTTISETFRRPRLSLGTFVLAILAIGVVGFGVVQWRKPSPYEPTPQALDWYNKGTDALRSGSFLQASKAFEQSIASDPNFPLAHARLAESLFELDYWDKAQEEMLKVHSLVPDRSRLARSDALYLEAINATVSRDFPGAIKAYRELVTLSPNDPQVYVDLGRAYEKNDELKNALASYVEATQHPPQYANAFLRVAIQYAEQADQPSATDNFDKAHKLFEAAGNFEGQAEVAYQRGAFYDKLGRKAEAKQNLQRALELSGTTSNQYQEVKTLLKLGNVASHEVDPVKARELINQAISTARANGIDNQVKRGLVDLGNTYVVTGEYDQAEKYFQESLQLSQQQKDNRNAARALLSLGSNSLRQSKVDESIKYIEQALPFYQQAGYRREALQALALLARGKLQRGDYEAARHAYEEQMKVAQQLGDMAQTQATLNDVGVTYALQGRYPEALKTFEESHAIAKSLKDEKNVGLCLINRGNALGKLGRDDEARALLSEVSLLAQRPNAAKNLIAGFYLSQALSDLRAGNLPQAKTNSEKAIELGGTQLKNIVAEAAYTLCLANTYSGAHVEGRRKCEAALARARETGNPSHVAESLLANSQLLLQTGDTAGALSNSLEAQKIFSKVGKQDSEWIAFLIAGRASKAQSAAAREYASRADQILAGLEQQWGADNFQAYLSRPDVNVFRRQLQDLLAQNLKPH